MRQLQRVLGFQWRHELVPDFEGTDSPEYVLSKMGKKSAHFLRDHMAISGYTISLSVCRDIVDSKIHARMAADGADTPVKERLNTVMVTEAQNAARTYQWLRSMVQNGQFSTLRAVCIDLHGILAAHIPSVAGCFRGEDEEIEALTGLPNSEYCALIPDEIGAPRLNRVYVDGIRALQESVSDPFEMAVAYFLFIQRQQFFRILNVEIGLVMLNGILLDAGFPALRVPASLQDKFDKKLHGFHMSQQGDEMFNLLAECYQEEAYNGIPDAKLSGNQLQ
ncbi:hypothetical protein [Thalassospira xiamenensis]|uniref:Fic/DOC family protein n=1 Tax=Thalassospira xiamenensis TaxID=220697 RepID=A0A285TY17_9PROT|nr:hypothetical protein [Thalassospira xiamenensis]SOC30399.1 hypothetical protein SAMN05428964_10930 [Thalassospira xiamenensis]